jgi:hypothetical protein
MAWPAKARFAIGWANPADTVDTRFASAETAPAGGMTA